MQCDTSAACQRQLQCVCVCVSAFINVQTAVHLIHSYELWCRLSVSKCILTYRYSSQHEYYVSLRIYSAVWYGITVPYVYKMKLQTIKTKIFYTFIGVCERRRKRMTFLRCTRYFKITHTSCLFFFSVTDTVYTLFSTAGPQTKKHLLFYPLLCLDIQLIVRGHFNTLKHNDIQKH
jgi:hypothetical protein